MCSENLEETFDSSKAAALLTQLFDNQWLESQARSSRFIERSSSRLTGQIFLMLNVLELSTSPDDSLQDQCSWLSSHFGVEIKKQSLDGRYNTHGVAFLKGCLQQVLGKWLASHKPQGQVGSFKRMVLRDSTSWQLPACLSVFYPSKDSSKTGVSIKVDYSVDQTPEVELYDIRKDPYCLTNLAAESSFRASQEKLENQLMAYLKKTKDPRMSPEGEATYEAYKWHSPIRKFPEPK